MIDSPMMVANEAIAKHFPDDPANAVRAQSAVVDVMRHYGILTCGFPGGWKLVPMEPTNEMHAAMVAYDGTMYTAPFRRDDFLQDYAAMLNAAPVPQKLTPAEPLVRYCPGCGSIGPVETQYRDCCPDGSEARLIPQPLAEKCRHTHRVAVKAMMANTANTKQATIMVPVEPTADMLKAAIDAYSQPLDGTAVRIIAAHKAMLAAAPTHPTTAAPAADGGMPDDSAMLDWLRNESCDLRCIESSSFADDADILWVVIEHHMAKPHEREIGRSFSDEPRDAIRAAMVAVQSGGARNVEPD